MESNPPMARRGNALPATDAASFSTSDSLTSQLSKISMVRLEKVAQGQSLASDGQYPPDYVLDRIAVLLAAHHVGDTQSNSSTEPDQ